MLLCLLPINYLQNDKRKPHVNQASSSPDTYSEHRKDTLFYVYRHTRDTVFINTNGY